MKKVVIGVLTAIVLLIGLFVWQGEAILDMIFYDMDATMDLTENLYDEEGLLDPGK